MYKWHIHSAIGRGRPHPGELSKVADGIAASLRQFHVSASRAAEDGGQGRFTLHSRAQRSATAAAEISSLSPGGIDARSFAAKPPPNFTIRRVDEPNAAVRRPPGSSRGGFLGQGWNTYGNSGASSARGGIRGRGGRGGRGGGSRGGRGNAKRHARKRKGGPQSAQQLEGAPLTPEEQAYVDSVEMGLPTPARIGLTTLETLKRDAPGMPTTTAPIGPVNTIREHYRVLAGEFGNERLSTEQHAVHYLKKGATLFVDEEDRAKAIGPDRWAGSPETYDTLDEAERESILQTLAAGRYETIKPMVRGDTWAMVDGYTQKNETYLPRDAAALKARVQKILPSQAAAKPAAQAAPI